MSEQTEMVDQATPEAVEDATPDAPGTTIYTVQMYVADSAIAVTAKEGEPVEVWQDVATLRVPLRTKRKTIIAAALAQAGISPDPAKPRPRVRVLDEESAAVVEPDPYQPPAEWRVS